ncbi:FAD-binding protein [Streptosporangium canum]|uniref:FAD-binding protein n=1 Tax=Streptosporangium canum TaxID=324952 RepID=UPI0033B5CE79
MAAHLSRRDENTGDSFRLAVLAGGRIRDPELVQFHPSGLIAHENVAGTLVSETARDSGRWCLAGRVAPAVPDDHDAAAGCPPDTTATGSARSCTARSARRSCATPAAPWRSSGSLARKFRGGCHTCGGCLVLAGGRVAHGAPGPNRGSLS